MAEWTGALIDDIQALNPELRRWTTPVRMPKYDLKVPVGTGDALRARLSDTSTESLTALQWHTVKRGESLLTIARKLNVRQADLAAANFISLKARVTPGQELIIPREPTMLLAARTDAPAPETQMAVARPAVPVKASLAEATNTRLDPQKVIYRVKRGDTLISIARVYHTTVASLKSWNARTIVGNKIHVGDRLTILTTRTHATTN